MKINANQTHNSTLSSPQVSSANVRPSLNNCDGLTPFILFHAIEDIKADKKLLFDYGKSYWSNHDNNHDLSNPDAQIYRNLLSMKKFSRQSPSMRFLRLIKAHNEHLYKNLLKHIKAPLSHLSGKDRLVECRKIHECNDNNHAIDYRIYKLPGEDPSQGPSGKDYVSINWNPLLPLGLLNQYNWKESK